jgi:hypothetical protein
VRRPVGFCLRTLPPHGWHGAAAPAGLAMVSSEAGAPRGRLQLGRGGVVHQQERPCSSEPSRGPEASSDTRRMLASDSMSFHRWPLCGYELHAFEYACHETATFRTGYWLSGCEKPGQPGDQRCPTAQAFVFNRISTQPARRSWTSFAGGRGVGKRLQIRGNTAVHREMHTCLQEDGLRLAVRGRGARDSS